MSTLNGCALCWQQDSDQGCFAKSGPKCAELETLAEQNADLLAALEEIQLRLEAKNYHGTPDCLNNDEQCIVAACRAVIAKAKGEA